MTATLLYCLEYSDISETGPDDYSSRDYNQQYIRPVFPSR